LNVCCSERAKLRKHCGQHVARGEIDTCGVRMHPVGKHVAGLAEHALREKRVRGHAVSRGDLPIDRRICLGKARQERRRLEGRQQDWDAQRSSSSTMAAKSLRVFAGGTPRNRSLAPSSTITRSGRCRSDPSTMGRRSNASPAVFPETPASWTAASGKCSLSSCSSLATNEACR